MDEKYAKLRAAGFSNSQAESLGDLMSEELQLIMTLKGFVAKRKEELDFGPFADLIIPLKDNRTLRVPIALLINVPE